MNWIFKKTLFSRANSGDHLKRNYGILLATTSGILWGAAGTLAAYVFKDANVSPLWVVNVRLLIAGLLLLLIFKMTKHQSIFNIWRINNQRKLLLKLALLGIMPTQLLYFITVKMTNPAMATILQFTAPVFILVYLSFSNRKFPSFMGIVSIIMAITGSILLATKGNLHLLSSSKLGLLLGLGSGMASAVSTVIPAKLIHQCDAVLVSGWAMFVGSLPLIPFFLIGHQPALNYNFVSEMVFIIILGTMVPYLCYITSIKYLNAEITGILNAFEPLTAAILSILLLNLHVNIFEVVGGALIIAMTIIQSLPKKQG